MQNFCASQTANVEVTLLLGSNMPFRNITPDQLLMAAARSLESEIGPIIRKTTMNKSSSWGFSGQEFWNQILVCSTTSSPLDILSVCEDIERRFGRGVKAGDWRSERVYADRTLDIDILYFGDLTHSDSRLEIPHPKISERPFVLELLREL